MDGDVLTGLVVAIGANLLASRSDDNDRQPPGPPNATSCSSTPQTPRGRTHNHHPPAPAKREALISRSPFLFISPRMALRLTSAVWDAAQTFDAFALSVNRRAYCAVNLPSKAGWVRARRTQTGGDAVRAGSGTTPWPRLSERPGSGRPSTSWDRGSRRTERRPRTPRPRPAPLWPRPAPGAGPRPLPRRGGRDIRRTRRGETHDPRRRGLAVAPFRSRS